MMETMEQYMRKTRADYGSRVARPKLEDKDNFELKGQFLKELRTDIFSGSDHEDANEHIEKVLEIVDLFLIPNITIDQVMLRAFPMSLTGAVSCWLRNEPTGSITTWDGLKTKFLNKYCPPARTAKKIKEINNFQQEPDKNLYQAYERFKELLMKCPQHNLTKMQEVILFYNGLGIPTRQILDSRGGITSKTAANAKYQEQRQSMEDTISKFMSESAKRHKENSNMIKEIRASTDATIRNQGASIKTLEIQIGQMSKILPIRRIYWTEPTLMYKTRQTTISFPSLLNGYCCEEKKGSYGPQFSEAYSEASHINNSIPRKEKDPRMKHPKGKAKNVLVGASVSVMPLLTYLNLGLGGLAHTKLTVKLADMTMKYPKGIAENVLVGIGKFVFPVDFIILDMPEDIKVTLILGRPFLSTPHAKIDVFKGKITLRVGEERIIFKSIKPANSLIKRVYMLSLRERMELDLEARLMGETLVINISLDPLNGDYIKLNDLNEPFKLRRNQGDNFMPTIKEGGVIEEFRTKDDKLDTRIDDYPSCCDYDKKIHIDYAHNLKFSCMIGFEFTHVNFFPLLYVNVMSKKFHNSIMKDKMAYKGNNVIGAIMNVPIFVGTFSVVIDFAVLEDMDAYRDEGMCDVSDKDKKNGISHLYQKLKGFYKGVLNLGPDYIRDAKMKEWLTRGHISVHEMEW
ncbi:hypothetical protein Tco_1264961 [Tanacetum coccineum]